METIICLTFCLKTKSKKQNQKNLFAILFLSITYSFGSIRLAFGLLFIESNILVLLFLSSQKDFFT